jgi:ATP-binding cassette subfamily B protein
MGKNSDKKRPSHTLISNIGYIFRLQWKYSKASLLLLLLGVPISLGISYCGIYMPKAVVEQIMTGGDFYKVFIPILIIGIITLFLNISNQIIATINFALLPKFKNCLLNLKAEKCLNTDYENIESPKFRFLMQRADEALMGSNSGSAVEQMSKGSIALLTSILGYIMFGTVLSFAHPIIILILTIMPVINYFVIRSIQKFQYKSKNETIPLDKKLWYIATNAENYKSAKDIRIYGMNSWLINMFRYFTKERLKWDVRLSKKHFIASVIDGVIILLRDGTAYVILIYMVINEQISIDNFILFFSAVGSFTSAAVGSSKIIIGESL